MTYARVWQLKLSFPRQLEPEWKGLVERWYQLDPAAVTLNETFWRYRHELPEIPRWVFLASPGASNATDRQFAQGVTPSPAKFVHTLPNIRAACLLQVMGKTAQVLCVQNDPHTVISAISEALHLVDLEGLPVWVLAVQESGSECVGTLMALGLDSQHATLKIRKNDAGTRASGPSHDRDLFFWLNESEQVARNFIADDFEILKSRAEQ